MKGTGEEERAGVERVGQEGWGREAVMVVEGMAVKVKGRVEVAVKDWAVAVGLGRVAAVVAMVATVKVVVEGWVEEVARARARAVWVAVHMPEGCQAPPLTPCRWGWGHTPADSMTRKCQDNALYHRHGRERSGTQDVLHQPTRQHKAMLSGTKKTK